MRALIVDSELGRSSLAAARALCVGGWTVGVAGPSRAGLAMLSRSVRHRHVIPPHHEGAEAFVEAIGAVAHTHRYEIVFGCNDAEVLTLSRERERLAALVPYARHEVVMRAIDKLALSEAAERVGIATPPLAASAAEALRRWGAPIVVKERVHAPADGARSHLASLAFYEPEAVDRRVREVQAAGSAPLLQPLLDGQLTAFTSVVNERGEMLARVQQIAERTYPRDAGLSVRACTVAIDEELATQVQALLAELSWFGLSELQFIRRADGVPVLLDFNARFYGSLALALAAGVNLPDTWARAATAREPVRCGDARPEVRYQWLEGDLRAARERATHPLRDAAECFRYGFKASASIWSATDPVPGLITAGALVGQTARRLARSSPPAGAASDGRPA